MNDANSVENIWEDDRLGYAQIGISFTNIIQSIADSRVISIEAPFGHGKTFFRKRWAKQLRSVGELVIEIDAQRSDHSGDPLITFIGELMGARPDRKVPKLQEMKADSLKWGGLIGKTILKAGARGAADELISAIGDEMKLNAPEGKSFNRVLESVQKDLSSLAGQLITAHLAAERARKELPEQIRVLRDSLVAGNQNDRIVIIIDELDRCHPEYAISLLEAMKAVFDQKGFVFCLMINPNYLEGIASHQFGTGRDGEFYLEKFIDFRLRLAVEPNVPALVAENMFSVIKVSHPFGPEEIFGTLAAVDLAGRIVKSERPSMRQLKRAVDRVDLATRMYSNSAIDLPLLVALTFADALSDKDLALRHLDRARLSPERAVNLESEYDLALSENDGSRAHDIEALFHDYYSELFDLEGARYDLPELPNGGKHSHWRQIIEGLAHSYIPNHEAMLNGVMRVQA